MLQEVELAGFCRDRYFARSWALLTRDRGWIKPVLVMTVSLLVPIVGLFGVMGYALEWARLTAWNVNAAPKQRNVRVGECICSGARAFVIILAWGFVSAIVTAVLDAIPLLGGLLAFAWSIVNIFMGTVILVAELRATIYKKLGAGFRVSAIRAMVSHDLGGLMRVFGIGVIGWLMVGGVSLVILLTVFVGTIPQLLSVIDYVIRYDGLISETTQAQMLVQAIFSLLSVALPALVVMGLVTGFVSVIFMLLGTTAAGLWMRQFDVPSWGRDEDPLPPTIPDPRAEVPPTYATWRPQPQPAAVPQTAAPKPEPQPASQPTPQPHPQPASQPHPTSQSESQSTNPVTPAGEKGASSQNPTTDESL